MILLASFPGTILLFMCQPHKWNPRFKVLITNRRKTAKSMFSKASFLCVAFAVLALCLAGCGSSSVQEGPLVYVAQASPNDVYNVAIEKLRPLVAENSKIMREDSVDGITLRCSISPLKDRKLKLIEIAITKNGATESTVRVKSENFSFIRMAKREPADVEIEKMIHNLLTQ